MANYPTDIKKIILQKVGEKLLRMFHNCKEFNSDINNWDVSKVESMNIMFQHCKKFTCDLSKWKVSEKTKTINIFWGCPLEDNPPAWYEE